MRLKIGSKVQEVRIYVVPGTQREFVIGDDIMNERKFTIGYPQRWISIDGEQVPTEMRKAPRIKSIEETTISGIAAQDVTTPPRSGTWIPVAASKPLEGKDVMVGPNEKLSDDTEVLMGHVK